MSVFYLKIWQNWILFQGSQQLILVRSYPLQFAKLFIITSDVLNPASPLLHSYYQLAFCSIWFLKLFQIIRNQLFSNLYPHCSNCPYPKQNTQTNTTSQLNNNAIPFHSEYLPSFDFSLGHGAIDSALIAPCSLPLINGEKESEQHGLHQSFTFSKTILSLDCCRTMISNNYVVRRVASKDITMIK